MESLKNNLHLLEKLKNIVKNKSSDYFTHEIINNNDYTDNTISIVMTSHERSSQVYYTLKTISKSNIKDIQVILVDDSSNDIVDINVLKTFTFNIDFIRINRVNKFWSNPCVNYNIGFEYIKGQKVVIQNSEVCHIGDVLNYINKNVIDNNHYVFDVRTSLSFETNEHIYKNETTIQELRCWNSMWYQHHIFRNVCYHFLVALTKDTFDSIKGFSYDYSFGSCYDDDDLIFKIKSLDIKIVNVINEIENVAGIHLFHGYERNITDKRAYQWNTISNKDILDKKSKYMNINKKYIEVSDGKDINEIFKCYTDLNKY